MPRYDYRCANCGDEFEVMQSMMDEHIKKCPKCSGPVQPLISKSVGIAFKGSGFYITDSTKKTKTAPKKPSKPEKKKKDTKKKKKD